MRFNKPKVSTHKLINHYFPNIFQEIMTPDYFPSATISKTEMLTHLINKYHLDREKTLMIGDGYNDLCAAKEVGCNFAFAKFGYDERKDLISSKSDFVIESYKSFLK